MMFRIRINFILPVYYSGSTNNISLYSFVVSKTRRDSVGGGVVAHFFRRLRGGVVTKFFSRLQNPTRFSGGGVVAEFFRRLQKPTRDSVGGE